VTSRVLVISFTSDWLYPSYQSLETVSALRGRNKDVAYCELPSNYGHDAFLVDVRRTDGYHPRLPRQHLPGDPLMPAAFVHSVLGRSDYAIISELIEPGTKVLDLAAARASCWRGWPRTSRWTGAAWRSRGARVQRAIARGVFGLPGRHRSRLARYPDQIFDYVILSQTLQETRQAAPGAARTPCASDGRPSSRFPNFGHWTVRLAHLWSGGAPKTKLFPHDWYDSPNIHFLTSTTSSRWCAAKDWRIERRIFLAGQRDRIRFAEPAAEIAVFMLRSSDPAPTG